MSGVIEITGTVKWFDGKKRKFGFIIPDGGGPDVLVHLDVLLCAGLKTLEQGQRVRFESELYKNRRRARSVSVLDGPKQLGTLEQGYVKFYRPDKCYGFIIPDTGGPDVFVHKTVITKAGLHHLKAGMRIQYRQCISGVAVQAIDLR